MRTNQKRRRPFRGDGGCREKGVPSSGEKIVAALNQLSAGGAWLWRIAPRPPRPGRPCRVARDAAGAAQCAITRHHLRTIDLTQQRSSLLKTARPFRGNPHRRGKGAAVFDWSAWMQVSDRPKLKGLVIRVGPD